MAVRNLTRSLEVSRQSLAGMVGDWRTMASSWVSRTSTTGGAVDIG